MASPSARRSPCTAGAAGMRLYSGAAAFDTFSTASAERADALSAFFVGHTWLKMRYIPRRRLPAATKIPLPAARANSSARTQSSGPST